jgi:hypothetical protein
VGVPGDVITTANRGAALAGLRRRADALGMPSESSAAALRANRARWWIGRFAMVARLGRLAGATRGAATVALVVVVAGEATSSHIGWLGLGAALVQRGLWGDGRVAIACRRAVYTCQHGNQQLEYRVRLTDVVEHDKDDALFELQQRHVSQRCKWRCDGWYRVRKTFLPRIHFSR